MKTIKFIGLLLFVLVSLNVTAEPNLSNKNIVQVILVNKLAYVCQQYPKNRCKYFKTSAASLPWELTPSIKGKIPANHRARVPFIKQFLGYSVDLGPVRNVPQQIELITKLKHFRKIYWVVRVVPSGFNLLNKPPRRQR